MEKIFRLPDIGEGVAEAELVEWLVNVGDMVTEDHVLAVVTTDKANVEVPSPYAGKVTWLNGSPGDMISVGSEFAHIDDLKQGSEPVETLPEPSTDNSNVSPHQEPTHQRKSTTASSSALAAPAVRARAKSLGIDLSQLSGTGLNGQVTHADLDQKLSSRPAAPTKSVPAFTAVKSDLPVDVSRLSSMRRAIAQKMSEAKSSIPHFSYVEEVDVTDVEHLRKEMNANAVDDERLSILPFVMKAMVEAIEDYPHVNALYDSNLQTLHIYKEVRLGLAVSTDRGLMVPVVSNAQDLPLKQCASAIRQAAEAARSGKAARENLIGSTITLTSLGALGGVVSTPVINPPEVAIVGVNKVRTLPKWTGESFEPRQMMNLSCSFDHRILDGAAAANFVQAVKKRLETPKV